MTDQTTFQEEWVKSQLPVWVSLPLPLTTGRWLDTTVEQVIGDHRMKFEANSLRLFGDVDKDAIGDGLGTRVGVDNVPAFVFIHCRNELASKGTAFQTDYENSL